MHKSVELGKYLRIVKYIFLENNRKKKKKTDHCVTQLFLKDTNELRQGVSRNPWGLDTPILLYPSSTGNKYLGKEK